MSLLTRPRRKAPVIHCIAEITSLSDRALAAIGFRFMEVSLSRTEENWLVLQVDWEVSDPAARWKTKYTNDGGTGSSSGGGSQTSYVELEFPHVPAPYYSPGSTLFSSADYAEQHKASIEVGIGIRTGRQLNPTRLGYRYQFHDQTKWGVVVWYSPDGWASETYKPLFTWRGRRGKMAA